MFSMREQHIVWHFISIFSVCGLNIFTVLFGIYLYMYIHWLVVCAYPLHVCRIKSLWCVTTYQCNQTQRRWHWHCQYWESCWLLVSLENMKPSMTARLWYHVWSKEIRFNYTGWRVDPTIQLTDFTSLHGKCNETSCASIRWAIFFSYFLFNSLRLADTSTRQSDWSSLFEWITCRLFNGKLLKWNQCDSMAIWPLEQTVKSAEGR